MKFDFNEIVKAREKTLLEIQAIKDTGGLSVGTLISNTYCYTIVIGPKVSNHGGFLILKIYNTNGVFEDYSPVRASMVNGGKLVTF